LKQHFSAILFDLDGTLVNTAPDLAYALNTLLKEEGMAALPYQDIRPAASHGSAALLKLGFNIDSQHKDYSDLQQRFLQIYQDNIARETHLFDGMDEVLSALEQADITWGIITNKPAFLTEPLCDALDLSRRAACIVSADTTPFPKPHPAPMLYACEVINLHAEQCVYIGDAARDIEAGKSVNMTTVAALYGYLSENDNADDWHADFSIEHPSDILEWI